MWYYDTIDSLSTLLLPLALQHTLCGLVAAPFANRRQPLVDGPAYFLYAYIVFTALALLAARGLGTPVALLASPPAADHALSLPLWCALYPPIVTHLSKRPTTITPDDL